MGETTGKDPRSTQLSAAPAQPEVLPVAWMDGGILTLAQMHATEPRELTPDEMLSLGWTPLYTAPAPAWQAVAWRPIETAPRDGTLVLTAIPLAFGQWTMVVGLFIDRWVEAWEHDPMTCNPTHWMPLPAAPDDASAPAQPAAADLAQRYAEAHPGIAPQPAADTIAALRKQVTELTARAAAAETKLRRLRDLLSFAANSPGGIGAEIDAALARHGGKGADRG